ncbi:tetratricopeptide repeat protein [Pedobacter sp. SYSU D00535]|uniref:tetratricopeptide repeat protein n=1 Tax=Pedobacter sp. SYSU D00535 TaxID=2810308 RepID=UPI001A95EDEB|nr:tetratricopeptide repeat protein [Pedobacter sp. SYSU D00535]
MKKLVLHLLLIFTISSAFSQRSNEDALAAQYYQNGEFDKALTIYEKLFRQNSAGYYDQYLNSLFNLKKHDEAEKVIKNMIKTFPDNYTYQVDYGKLLQERGQQEKAADWYNGLVRNLQKNEYAIRELSINFYRADAFDYAIKTLLNGRKVLNDDMAFAFDLLSLYRFQKNKPMLVEEYINLMSVPQESDQIVNQAKSTFSMVFETPEDYNGLRQTLIKRLQKNPQNLAYSELLSWVYLQQKQYDLALRQTIALDKRLKEEGDRVYDLSLLLVANKAYAPAVEGFQYLLTKGDKNQYYIPSKIQILSAKSEQLTARKFSPAELTTLEKEYLEMLKEFGKGRNTVFAMRQLARLQAQHLGKAKEAELLLEETLKVPALPPSIVSQIKLELADVYILTGEVWEAALIYGQVEKDFANEPAGQEAKFRNAKLSYFQGDFAWAKAQLDVLKSSTSQLIANDALNLSLLIQENTATRADTNALKIYARADHYIFSNMLDKALTALDSINVLFPGNSLADDILMAKSRIYLKQNDLSKATAQLQLIVDNFSFDLWADDALFILGDLYETRLNDAEKAKVFYQKIITDYPGSLHVTEARKRFRTLRGDSLG